MGLNITQRPTKINGEWNCVGDQSSSSGRLVSTVMRKEFHHQDTRKILYSALTSQSRARRSIRLPLRPNCSFPPFFGGEGLLHTFHFQVARVNDCTVPESGTTGHRLGTFDLLVGIPAVRACLTTVSPWVTVVAAIVVDGKGFASQPGREINLQHNCLRSLNFAWERD